MTKQMGKRVAGVFIFLAAVSLFGAMVTMYYRPLILASLICWAVVAVIHFLPKKED